jgi:hypothetical protein
LRRDPILVSLLNLIPGAGWGYFALGQLGKGIIATLLYGPLFFITWGPGAVLLSFITAIDAYLQARQLAAGRAIGKWTFFKKSTISAQP